jgi:hypothetical protein
MLHSIIINSLDKKERYYFAVDKEEEKSIYKNLPLAYKSFFTFKSYGYGVAKINGNFPENLELFDESDDPFSTLLKYRNIKNNNGKSEELQLDGLLATCGQGGEGATSCSIGGDYGCSVSCKAGYYACCNSGLLSNSCKCNREPPIQ